MIFIRTLCVSLSDSLFIFVSSLYTVFGVSSGVWRPLLPICVFPLQQWTRVHQKARNDLVRYPWKLLPVISLWLIVLHRLDFMSILRKVSGVIRSIIRYCLLYPSHGNGKENCYQVLQCQRNGNSFLFLFHRISYQ